MCAPCLRSSFFFCHLDKYLILRLGLWDCFFVSIKVLKSSPTHPDAATVNDHRGHGSDEATSTLGVKVIVVYGTAIIQSESQKVYDLSFRTTAPSCLKMLSINVHEET